MLSGPKKFLLLKLLSMTRCGNEASPLWLFPPAERSVVCAAGSAEFAEFAEVASELIAVIDGQGIVFYDVLHVIDDGVELILIELAFTQLPVELGKVMLGVVITFSFLFIGWREIFGVAQVPLHVLYQTAGVAVTALGVGSGGNQY
jgi:hypothetical protein